MAVNTGGWMTPGVSVTVRDLVKTYRPRYAAPTEALRGVSLDVAAGEAVAVVGPSGSGKSTLLAIIGTLEVPDGGAVEAGGENVSRLSGRAAADFRFRRVGFIFQQYHLLPGMTVVENLLARYIGRRRPPDAVPQALSLLERVGLGEKTSALPRELSGGEQQRVCVARALLGAPDLVLADEPTGNLDSKHGAAVIDLLLELVRERGATLLLVTHNPAYARRMARVLAMRDGRIAP